MPTYNEAESVGRIIDQLCGKVFPKIKGNSMTLLVVDSHSPDGTWKIVNEKSKKYKTVKLLDEGEKRGLGVAYNHGFTHAINKLKADGIMEMDADFQHDPNDVPKFVKAFDEGADYVIGSRYVANGSIPQEWTLDRKFLSVVGNLIYRIGLLMFDIHDFTTGYRLSRVKGFLDSIDLNAVFSKKSFTYKTWLLYEIKKRGGKIVEIPIKFGLRETGDSKMTTNNIFDSLLLIADIWKTRLSS
jgi:dolichol-phosphate mannosyltransferase